MSKGEHTADINADGKDVALGLTPPELQKVGTPVGAPMSLLESLGRRDMEGMADMNVDELTTLLEQVQKLKHLPGASEFLRLIEIALSERRSAGSVPEHVPFEHAPAEYADADVPTTDSLADNRGEATLDETAVLLPQKPTFNIPEQGERGIPHLPVIIGGIIFFDCARWSAIYRE